MKITRVPAVLGQRHAWIAVIHGGVGAGKERTKASAQSHHLRARPERTPRNVSLWEDTDLLPARSRQRLQRPQELEATGASRTGQATPRRLGFHFDSRAASPCARARPARFLTYIFPPGRASPAEGRRGVEGVAGAESPERSEPGRETDLKPEGKENRDRTAHPGATR